MKNKISNPKEASSLSTCLEPVATATSTAQLSLGNFNLTLKMLKDIIDSYTKMHDEAVAAGNHNAAKACKTIVSDLAACAKYANDYYNKHEDNQGLKDENAGNN